MSAASDILKLIKEKEIEFVDLRFTDPRGKLQHMTQDLTTIDEDFLNDGTFFDGSSIAGWKAINESDMILKPDLSRTFVDPFTSHLMMLKFLTLCKRYLSRLTVTKVLTTVIKNIQTETWVIDQLLKVVISQCLQLIAVRI
jgi:glutamine synthetase